MTQEESQSTNATPHDTDTSETPDGISDATLYQMLEAGNCTCSQHLTESEREGGAYSSLCEFHAIPYQAAVSAGRDAIREALEKAFNEELGEYVDELIQQWPK